MRKNTPAHKGAMLGAKTGRGQGRLEREERLSGARMEGNAEKASKGLGWQKLGVDREREPELH